MAVARSPSPAFSGASPSRGRVALIARFVIAAVIASSAAMGSASAVGGVSRTILPRPAALDAVTFHGRGYGHGVGLSQYGARGRAVAGQLAPAILAHYYPGTTLGSRSASTLVRVLVLSGFAASPTKPAIVTGRGGTWTVDAIPGPFPADARLLLAPTALAASTWAARVVSSAGALLASATVSAGVVVRPATASSLLELTSKGSASNLYRGELRIRLGSTATVVNALGLDLYVRGVVPAEMPASWPVEALKAQAIAARSYALYRLHPTTGSYDVYDDTRSQVYRGRKAETTTSNAAVTATAGMTLLRGSTPANALYHSADGGWTENNENVFVSSSGGIVSGAVAYLRGSSDRAPGGTSYDAASPYATWHSATYSGAALSSILAKDARTNVGALTALDLSRRGVSGRLISVTLTGSLATKTVSGDVFVAAFNAGRPVGDPALRSTLFALSPIP
jgi:stage II sporulation protein D